jgi:crossover junction endodeoxyribonuclease RuvC
MAIILGIDPSSVATGYAIMDTAGDLLDWGVIKPNKKKLTEPQQAKFQYDALAELIEKWEVSAIGCEDQHRGVNADTFKKLSRISGYLMLLAGQYDLPFELLHPSSWRKIVHGKGNAKKEDTLAWVKETYELLLSKKDNDIADAIGIAKAAVLHFTPTKSEAN